MLKTSAILITISAGAVLLWRASSLGAGELAKHPSLDNVAVESAVKHLRTAQKGSDMESVRSGIADAVDELGEKHFATEMLSSVESEAPTDIAQLQQGLGRVIESLTFRPWMEAEVPVGFPRFTPVHHIEVKTLPDYRMARAAMPNTPSRGGNGAFWKLFSHIKRNDIAMTAPVQMDYTGSDEDAEVASMAFLYGSKKIGAPGQDSADKTVEIIDIPEQDVVSIGVRGRMTPASLEAAQRRLLSWLDDHKAEHRVAGPLRRMGYNSPFISEDRAFFEVQIPVEKVKKTVVASSNS
jgi:hypothetical protein